MVEELAANQPADHEPHPSDRQKLQHGGVGDIMSEQFWIHAGKCAMYVGEFRKKPGARRGRRESTAMAQDIVRDIEEQHSAERVTFGFGREHSLGDITSAARFGARIPNRPPLDGDWND